MKANCVECGRALVPSHGWASLDIEARQEYRERGVAPRAGDDLCDRDYQARRRGGRSTYGNAELRKLFETHDPGDQYSWAQRYEYVAEKIGRRPEAIRRAAIRGKWRTTPYVDPRAKFKEIMYVDSLGHERWLKPVINMPN